MRWIYPQKKPKYSKKEGRPPTAKNGVSISLLKRRLRYTISLEMKPPHPHIYKINARH